MLFSQCRPSCREDSEYEYLLESTVVKDKSSTNKGVLERQKY